MGIWWYSSSKHGFLIHWLIIYTNECLVRLSSYLCVRVCVCVCMRDTANISMINTQHTTLPVKDSTVYFSWTQNKAHGHYLQLCTVCVCVFVCLPVCECVRGGWAVRAAWMPSLDGSGQMQVGRKKLWLLWSVHCGYEGWAIAAVVDQAAWACVCVCP